MLGTDPTLLPNAKTLGDKEPVALLVTAQATDAAAKIVKTAQLPPHPS